jgi:hypothetical protein
MDLTPWQQDALAALQAHDRAMRRATAARDGQPVDPDRAELNDRVLAFAAAHQLQYADALDRILSES